MMIDLREIKTFGILGGGTLGWRIGLQAAISGYEVLMHDISEKQLADAEKFQRQLISRLLKKERISETGAQDALARIKTTVSAARFSDEVDFVSESVTEEIELKRRVWGSFAGKWRQNTVLTTNTSYLLPSAMVDVVGDAERFCAFHFHDVFDARVVDVMPHPSTAPQVVDMLMQLGKTLNQIPVHVAKETSGYLFNAMLMAYIGAAGALLADGKASPEDIDRSWMGNLGTQVGPFGMIDQVGIDTVDHILSVRTDSKSKAFRAVIQPYLEQKKLGIKTGEGFYTYPKPAYTSTDFLT